MSFYEFNRLKNNVKYNTAHILMYVSSSRLMHMMLYYHIVEFLKVHNKPRCYNRNAEWWVKWWCGSFWGSPWHPKGFWAEGCYGYSLPDTSMFLCNWKSQKSSQAFSLCWLPGAPMTRCSRFSSSPSFFLTLIFFIERKS